MNDEIKEILESSRKIIKSNRENGFDRIIMLGDDIDKLLDYITNLQQENEELKKNQRYYKNGVFSLEYDKETLSDMVDDYKSRIEKTVEYIKNKLSSETYQHLKKLYDDIDSIEEIWEDYEFEDLLNILQNGSDSE